MEREAPVAVSIMGVIRDLQKVCQANDWLFEDRAPFLAYKVDLLLRQHQLRGLRGTSRLGYKRYGCAPHRTQDLAVQLQEYFRLGEQTEPYGYNVVAPGAPIDLVQLAMIYQTGPGRLGYHNFDKAIRRVAALHSSNEEYANFFLSGMPPNWFDAWVPRNTSCPPSRPGTKVDDVGVERSSSEGMSILMNGRRSRKQTRLRATRSTRTPSITGFCRWSQTPISTTWTSRSSSTSHRSTMNLRLHIDARSAAETKSSKRSLLTRLRAL